MSKSTIITERIAILEGEIGKSGNILGKEAGIGNGTVSGWTDNQIEKPTLAVEKFLTHYDINRHWWKTGKGDIFNTSVQNGPAIDGKQPFDLASAIHKVVEENSEYVLMHRTVLEGKYRLVAVEQFEIYEKELQRKERELERKSDDLIRKDTQIQGLYEIVKVLTSKLPDPAKVQEAKNNAGV